MTESPLNTGLKKEVLKYLSRIIMVIRPIKTGTTMRVKYDATRNDHKNIDIFNNDNLKNFNIVNEIFNELNIVEKDKKYIEKIIKSILKFDCIDNGV
nr:hypothetical protein [Candidatus Nasuia deltocephalinicola]